MTEDGLLVVDTERFHGPLELLLHLIRAQDIDIFDIPISRITRQFLAAIDSLGEADVDEAGEFLQMAAALVRIKARMLMPGPVGEEDQDPRAELVRRLLEYEQVREIANRLRTAENDRSRRYGKGWAEPRRQVAVQVELTATWDDVLEAALRIEPPEQRDREHTVFARRVAMRDKVDLILAAVNRIGRIEFSSLVAPWTERIHGVMTLLAGLELGRRRVVSLRQRKPFSPLWFYGSHGARGKEEVGRGPDRAHGPGAGPEAEAFTPGAGDRLAGKGAMP